jgi:pimeloyl-ACP methyl ester carboxylesterase
MTERVQPTSRFVTVNGLSLHYLEWGKAGLPVVVCVHGYTSSAQAFNAPRGTSRTDFTSSQWMCVGMARAGGRPWARTSMQIRRAI